MRYLQKITGIFNNHFFFLMGGGLLLGISLMRYYGDGCLILGGEGNHTLSFAMSAGKYAFSWLPWGVGVPNMVTSSVGSNFLIFPLIEKLTGSIAATNYLFIFLIYYFPFLAMYLVCAEIKASPLISFLCSLFYMINPFMLNYLTTLVYINNYSVAAMPLFLWVILKSYRDNFKLFFYFGIVSAFLSFASANPPMLIIIQISIFLSILLASYCSHEEFRLFEIVKKYCILLVSFVIFNIWWIFVLFVVMPDSVRIYTHDFADSWLDTTVRSQWPIMARMLSFRVGFPTNTSHSFVTLWFNNLFGKFFSHIPVFIVFYFALITKGRTKKAMLKHAVFFVLLIVLFFVKGNEFPLGFIYDFFYKYVPFFYVFKSPVEKFGLLYLFVFSVLLLLILIDIGEHKYSKTVIGIFLFYLVFCSVPLMTGNMIPDTKVGFMGYVSRKYKDKEEYKQIRKAIDADNFNYKVLSLPGEGNYQVLLPNYCNKYYTGYDPVLMNINRPFFGAYNGIDEFYGTIFSANYGKLLGLYNIGRILLNKDLIPWFGTVGPPSPEIEYTLGTSMHAIRCGNLILYENEDGFLPQIYVLSMSDKK